MRIGLQNGGGTRGRTVWFRMAYSLPDYMVTLALIGVVSAVILSAYLYAGRISMLTQTKLETNLSGRIAMTKLVHDIRTAAHLVIGTGNASTFRRAALGRPQRGDALTIFPTMNTNMFVRYFLDRSDESLKRVFHYSTEPEILATYVTNSPIFVLENIHGNVATNDDYNTVVSIRIQMDQPVYHDQRRPGELTDYYQMMTRVTQRTRLGYQDGEPSP